MPFNGTGTFVRNYDWPTDYTAGIPIDPDRLNADANDLADGLSNCITRDGQGVPLNDISWENYKLINLGEATSPGDAMSQEASDARYARTITSTTLNVPGTYANIPAAMAYLSAFRILPNETVIISVAAGTHTAVSPITLSHPDGARIVITGANTVTTTASSVGAIGGSAGAWTVPITVVSAAGMAANDYLILRNVTGTGEYLIFSGLCKISSVVGNVVTVVCPAKNTVFPTATLTGGAVTCIKTMLTFAGCDGLKIDGPLGQINKIVVAGNKTPSTIGLIGQRGSEGMKDQAFIYCGTSFGISSFGDGGVYAQYGGTVDAAYLCVSDCLIYNVLSQHNGSINFNYGISLGCAEAGIAASSSGNVSAETSISIGNGTYGSFCFQGGALLIPYSYMWSNVSDGWRAAWGGSIRGQDVSSKFNGGCGGFSVGGFAVTPDSICSNNASSGIYCEGGGSIFASGGVELSNNGTYGAYCDGGNIDCPEAVASSNGVNGFTATNGGEILANLASGTGNATYMFSCSNLGVIRATNAVTAGATCFSAFCGLIDLTSATGTPVLSYGSEGRFITTAGVLISGPARLQRDSTYNSESTAGLIIQNATTPLKMLTLGYDVTRDYSFIQSLHSTVGYKNLAINPNGGNVGIKLGTTAPTAAIHLPAGTTSAGSAPLKFTTGSIMTTPENMAVETDGTNVYFTNNAGVRKTFTLV